MPPPVDLPPPAAAENTQKQEPQGLMAGIMAANAQGPNGEVLSIVPPYYVFMFFTVVLSICLLFQCVAQIRRWCSRCRQRDVTFQPSAAEAAAHRQRRVDRFRDNVEVESSSVRRRV